MNSTIQNLHAAEILSDLDLHFGELIAGFGEHPDEHIQLAAALASSWRRRGHVCLDLADLQETMLLGPDGLPVADITLPEREDWVNGLRAADVVRDDQAAETCKAPLVLDSRGRLYLFRYWRFQKWLIEGIAQRVDAPVEGIDEARLSEGLDRLFPARPGIDWQRAAAVMSVLKRFSVISGGPGTGKTYTAARILVLLLEQDPKIRIAFAAPTGKAKSRLQESIKAAKADIDCDAAVKERIRDDQTFTVHRLLGGRPGMSQYRYNAENPLPYDVVILDETSMVDIALMARLIRALPPDGRLILLGDRDQLASVEAGTVLGDICDAGNEHPFSSAFAAKVGELAGMQVPAGEEHGPVMRDSIVVLRESRRFHQDSQINRLALAVNAGDAERAITIVKGGSTDELIWDEIPRIGARHDTLAPYVKEGYAAYLAAQTVEDALKAFTRFRILCAHRVGPYGSEALNEMVRDILAASGRVLRHGEWYHKRPVIVTENDYNLQLFNGDIGMTWEEAGQTRVYFPGEPGRPRPVRTTGMPTHETAYALTIHKSQGSEFERVLVMLSNRESRVMTRELVYTGITRAQSHVHIWATEPVFRQAVATSIQRASGLRDALWGGGV
ncbi:MAG: exodeoxyribonuclease V subunit alpha [Kiritimatiellae bacterium]|nr:exodeoxyribonuclease V subunit alpha [Kiritimatiellia bacterium]